jgi:cell division septation protein DedD
MTEPAFREIQLSKKQLVFLFMASVVLAAVVFLLGVSLGRRLPTSARTTGPEMPNAEAAVPAEMPPPTVLTADDQKFATELQGSGGVPPALPAPPPPTSVVPEPVQAKPTTSVPPVPATTSVPPAAKPAAEPASGRAAAAAAATAKPAPMAAGGWYVQVNAFRSRENADAEVRQLKAKGHAAFVAPSGSLFRVRVGPFADRGDADAASTKLRQDGFKPSVTR